MHVILFINMKNSLLLPIVFIANLFLWMAVLALVTQLGLNNALNFLINGKYILFFSGILYYGLYFTPFSVILSLLALYFFLIRHKSVVLLTFIFVVSISFVSVVFLVPFSYQLLDRFTTFHSSLQTAQKDDVQKLYSSGLIRTDTNSNRVIWYSVSDDRLHASPVIVINNQLRLGVPAITVYPKGTYSADKKALYADSALIMTNAGGDDPLIDTSLSLPAFIGVANSQLRYILDYFYTIWHEKYLQFIWIFGGFILMVLSIWPLCFMTGWRLLNVFLVFGVLCALFYAFPLTVFGVFYDFIRNLLPNKISSHLISPFICAFFSALILSVSFGVAIKRKTSAVRKSVSYE